MSRPNLQIALDHNDLEHALGDVMKVGDVVDIIEVGTILCLQEGQKAIRCIHSIFPDKKLVADTKCADAGGTVARNVANAGADWMTVICCATMPTMKAAQKEIGELQVELYGNWTFEQAKDWYNIGIRQVIYHQSRDALLSGEAWGEKDSSKVSKLIELGFNVSVTGGLNPNTLQLFEGIDVYTFIAGRGITAAEDPMKAAHNVSKMRSFVSGGKEMAQIGIYEKALPKDISWKERFSLVKEMDFDFIEMSIDETDERLARLDWSEEKIAELREEMFSSGVRIHSICLSAHRRFPFGSADPEKKKAAKQLMKKAIHLAHNLSVKVIQIAGYDVYYEEKSMNSREDFIEGIKESVKEASKYGIILSVEIMDDPFMNSISKFLEIKEQIHSPFLQVYPDLGNLSAWPENNPARELEKGIDYITAIHLKDTYPVTKEYSGQFRDVTFGNGCVDFLGLLRHLKRLDYDGTFLIEMWSEKSQDFRREIQQAKDYLSSKLKEAGYDVL